ncbi:MAG: flagellin [Acidobacteria bacterium]|nr:flagellin [Acidobacteriota bacterium]
MISNLDPATDRFLKDLSAISDRLNRTQQQIASGKRLQVASDEPDQISNLLERRAQLAHVVQIQKNLDQTKTAVDTSESGLQSATQLLDRIQTIAAQGANGTQTQDTRASLAVEVEGLFSQLVGIAQMSVDGRYIFSGNSDQAIPYALDLTQPNPLSIYGGSQASLQAMHPGGTTFTVARTAEEIFDNPDPAKNVFQAVNSLRLALQANDPDAVEQALGRLGPASRHLNSELAFYGNVQNQVATAGDEASKSQVRLRTELASIEDTDLTQAIVDLNQAKLQQEAALQTFSKIPRTSLFDYLG